jgi:hypothetical protein
LIEYRISFSGIKRLGSEVDHCPSDAEVKNAWSYNTLPVVCLYGAEREL